MISTIGRKMKRDFELLRKMVLSIEDQDSGWAPDQFKIPEYSEAQIGYHSYLLVDAGLAKGVDVTTNVSRAPEYQIMYLTWAGHEFADAARNESRWKEAMGHVKQKGEGITLAVLTQLLIQLAKNSLGL